MNKTANFIVIFVLICLAIGLGLFFGRQIPTAAMTENASCPVTMSDVIASAQGDVYNMEAEPSDYVEPDSYYLATYSVTGDSITNPVLDSVPADLTVEQKDSALQNEAWTIFTDLIPRQDRQMVTQFNVFTDGYSNTLAAVDQVKDDASQWILEVDVADLQDKDALFFTLIHEYAHLLTLNAEQVAPDQEIVDDPTNMSLQEKKAAECANYFTGTGCSYPNSYINAFYNRFWVDINDEWKKVDALQYGDDSTVYYEGLYSFYKAHQDQFVDDYATTHPTEDIAESFAYFVFSPKPSGNSIKEQKIAFFYDYPELVELRENILNGACSIK